MKKYRSTSIEYKIIKLIYNNFPLIRSGFIYVSCIILITIIAKKLIEYPVIVAYKYNIKLSSVEYVQLYSNYTHIFISTLIISICAIPLVKLVNRLKNASKNGIEFYMDDTQNQNINNIPIKKMEVLSDAILDIIKSDDEKIFDEESEENMYKSILQEQDNNMNLLKCQNVKSHMRPLTQLVTMELYNHSRDNVTLEITNMYVKKSNKSKGKKKEERNKEIAKNIIEFLNSYGIIESDDVLEDKYYFTSFGSIYMNYFSSGII